MAQSGNNVPVTCRSSVGRRRTAASPSCQLELPTLTGHPDFPEAAAEARGPSVSFAATKLPFVTSQLRPQPADGDSLRISLAGPPWMTGLRRPTWTPPWLNPAITCRSGIGKTCHWSGFSTPEAAGLPTEATRPEPTLSASLAGDGNVPTSCRSTADSRQWRHLSAA